MKNFLAKIYLKLFNLYFLLLESIKNYFLKKKVVFHIIESGDWAVSATADSLGEFFSDLYRITSCYYGIRQSIVHFGTVNILLKNNDFRLPHPSNKLVVTWYHIAINDERIKFLQEASQHVDLWHTTNCIAKEKMVSFGIPEDSIVIVPLGVNLKLFSQVTEDQKIKIRQKLGIPLNKVIIGSFQKDGNYWGEGLEPKLVKGPDIFL